MVSSSHFSFAVVQMSSDLPLGKMSLSMYVVALNANPKLREKLSPLLILFVPLSKPCQILATFSQKFLPTCVRMLADFSTGR